VTVLTVATPALNC